MIFVCCDNLKWLTFEYSLILIIEDCVWEVFGNWIRGPISYHFNGYYIWCQVISRDQNDVDIDLFMNLIKIDEINGKALNW